MATEVVAGGVGEIRALSTASGGTALSTTAVYIPLIRGTHHLFITPRNFATAVVAKFALNPYLVILKTANRMGTVTDYSNYAQDGSTDTDVTLSSLSTLANGDWLLVGAHLPFRGVYCDVDGTNSTASTTLAVHYWQDATTDAWADTSATDGTKSSTALDQDGLVYWTVPTDWKTVRLTDIYTGAYLADGTGTFTGSPVDLTPGDNVITCSATGSCTITLPTGGYGAVRAGTATISAGAGVLTTASANTVTLSATGTIVVNIQSSAVQFTEAKLPLYWTRWTWDKALDSSTTLNSMLSANRSTAYAELMSGQSFEERIFVGPTGVGCIEALVNAGTGNLIVNGASSRDGGF